MWQPDGWGQTRIGVLTPHADIVPESEFSALAPAEISIHATRVFFGAYRPGGAMDPTIADDPVRAFADPPLVDEAAELRQLRYMRLFMGSPAAAMCEVRQMTLR
jgi:maleate isomerase